VAMLTFLLALPEFFWEWRVARRIAADEAQQRQRAEAGELSAQRRAYISEINWRNKPSMRNNSGPCA